MALISSIIVIVILIGGLIWLVNRKPREGFIAYTIKKGRVLSDNNIISLLDKSSTIIAVFAESCWFETESLYIRKNILFGISYGFDSNYNSIKLHWKPIGIRGRKLIAIYLSVISRGEYNITTHLCNVELSEEIFFRIQRGVTKDMTDVVVIHKGKRYHYDNLPRCEESFPRFRIYPRVNYKAPQDLKIYIKDINFTYTF